MTLQLKTRLPITGEEKDKLLHYIRENLDDLSEEDWTWYSHDIDFTLDELREFEKYINWNTYFIYFTEQRKKNVSVEQVLEFKDRDLEWLMIFQQRKLDEPILRRWLWNYIDAVNSGWKWICKFQHLSKQFKEDYFEPLKPYLEQL